MGRSSHFAIALLLAAGASGCLDFSGTRDALTSIELCWNETPGTGSFRGKNCENRNAGTCRLAGVDTMEWSLTRAGTQGDVDGGSGDCANGIDIAGSPGEYTLTITGKGTNKDGQAVTWKATCKGLDALRFDNGYHCNIDGQIDAP